MKTESVPRRGSQATRPGSRAAGFRAAVTALATAVAVAAGITTYVLTRHGPAPAAAAPVQTYGGLPSWLPKPSVPVGRVVTASTAHPKLAIEGDTVHAVLSTGQLMATAVGPQVPEEGKFPVPASTRCTFTITLAKVTGRIPVSKADFAAVDENGNIHRLRLTVRGGGKVPAHVGPGQLVTLILTTKLPTGNGQLIWAPAGHTVVSWDFSVEID